ncbi:polyadenylate-binding protein-interacting protein 9-like isoform X2 [Magnolia sinica]|uniref:polyadenylate-binding protein-interacting protein 9-like isoform X2 n=1 Tax=Magnolia sinica TaxID=86752 RepID=UPI0026598364|nr:polyadenylate-binding protein-interacting protein 9-like isoform X2 [Magnolia sinica]
MAAVAENAIASNDQFRHRSSTASVGSAASDDSKSEFQRDVRKLVDLLSKLNPSAKEFFPSSYSAENRSQSKDSISDGSSNNRRRKNNYNQWRRRLNGRGLRAQREDSIRRTVYVAEIDQHVTEEQLATLFAHCGQVVDCRVCGDPHSVLRFAFVEFADEQGAAAALSLSGTMLGYYPVRVLPSKTAILPVNPTFLPRSEDEREMCARTVYCTNIDKKVSQADVKIFFETYCGEVSRLRLLGDHLHSTRIAFVEFVLAESAIIALNCSGMALGSLLIRVSPSKTPVRPRVPRAMLH